MNFRASRILPLAGLAVSLAARLAAGELAPATEAKFVRVITLASGGANSYRTGCGSGSSGRTFSL